MQFKKKSPEQRRADKWRKKRNHIVCQMLEENRHMTQQEALKKANRIMDVLDGSNRNIKPPKEPCPQCGSKLLIRHRRVTSDPFIGCAGFPSCRYTRSA